MKTFKSFSLFVLLLAITPYLLCSYFPGTVISSMQTPRMEWATLANGNGAATTCLITSQSGSFISGSGVRNTTGDCSWTITTGYFSSAPTCVCSSQAGAPTTNLTCTQRGTNTATAIRLVTNSGGTNADQTAYLICTGPR